jgi:hypothetical protein
LKKKSQKIIGSVIAGTIATGIVVPPFSKVQALSIDMIYAQAYEATANAMVLKTQKAVNDARTVIAMLPTDYDWAIGEFSKQVDRIQHPIFVKAYDAIVKAQASPSQEKINFARVSIDPDMPAYYKGSYSQAVDAIQQKLMKEALEAFNKASNSKLKADIDYAKVLINEVKSSLDISVSNWAKQIEAQMDGIPGIQVISIKPVDDINVTYGTVISNLSLPKKITLNLSDKTTKEVDVKWTYSFYNANNSGTYTFDGSYELPSGFSGEKPTASVKVIVAAPAYTGGGSVYVPPVDPYAAINTAGNRTGNYTINTIEDGTFGPESGVNNITGNVELNINATEGQRVVISNLNISGALSIDFADGDVILNNIIVNGLNVSNVGSSSLHLTGNSSVTTLTVADSNDDARIVVEGNANVATTNIQSGAKIELAPSATSLTPFGTVNIAPTQGETVIVAAKVATLNVNATSKLELTETANVTGKIDIKAPVEIKTVMGTLVAAVEITTANPTDKVVVYGNVGTVTINRACEVEVKSGSATLVATTDAPIVVKSETGTTVAVGTTGNFNTIDSHGTTTTVVTPPIVQPVYNVPGGIYNGENIEFNVLSTDSERPSLLGPTSGIATINSDIIVKAGENNFATLRNLVVYGRVIIDGNGQVGGSITLDNVTVNKTTDDTYGFTSGQIVVKEVATNSLHLENGVSAAQLLIEDKNGSRIDVKEANLGEVVIKDDGNATNAATVSLELSDYANINELLVETEDIAIKDNTTIENGLAGALGFIQGDGVNLENIKTDSNSDLSEVRASVNSEEKFKAKLAEINGLYRSSNGVTDGALYDYINNKLRLLIENIADMNLSFKDASGNDKTFVLSEAYKKFSVIDRNAVAGHVNSSIRDQYHGSITELYQLEDVFSHQVKFVVREDEIRKFYGRENSYIIDISKANVGEELQEMFMVKPGEVLSDYYIIEPKGVTGGLVQFYNNKFYLMKNFDMNYKPNRQFGSTKILVDDNPNTIPAELKSNGSNTSLNFMFDQIIGITKDISFVDMVRTESGLKVEVQAKGFDDAEILNQLAFNIGNVPLTAEIEGVIGTSEGYKLYIFNVSNVPDLSSINPAILTVSFSENDQTYNYIKRFTVESRELERIYQYRIVTGMVDGKLKINAVDKASDYSETNKKFILKVELESLYDNAKWSGTQQNFNPAGFVSDTEHQGVEPIIEAGYAQFSYAEDGHAIIRIPLTLKRQPVEGENWVFRLSDWTKEVNVSDIQMDIDFGNVEGSVDEIPGSGDEEVSNISLVAGYPRVTPGELSSGYMSISLKANENGIARIAYLEKDAQVPTAEQIFSSLDSQNRPFYNWIETGLTGEQEINTGFFVDKAGTDYDVYVALKDANGVILKETTKVIVKSPEISPSGNGIRWISIANVPTFTRINNSVHTVDLEVPSGTDIRKLQAFVSVSQGATLVQANGILTDFTDPVTYTVKAQDGSTQDWTIICSVKGAADTAAPIFVGMQPQAKDIKSNEASIVFAANEDFKAYFVLLEAGSTAPSVDQVIETQDANGNLSSGGSMGFLPGNMEHFIKLNYLQVDHSYEVYIVLVDKAGNKQAEVTKVSFTTAAAADDGIVPAFNDGYPQAKNILYNSADLTFKTSERSTMYYVLLDPSREAPDVDELIKGTDGQGVKASSWGSLGPVPANIEITKQLQYLQPNQQYDVYLLLIDESGVNQATPTKISFTTADEQVVN